MIKVVPFSEQHQDGVVAVILPVHDCWLRIDLLSEAIYDVFAPVEVVGSTPEVWHKQTLPLYDYVK